MKEGKSVGNESRGSLSSLLGAASGDSASSHRGLELLSAISHEMRTPLTTILALTSLILAEKVGGLTPLQRDFLTSIQLGARRLSHLAEHILDLYCAEMGQFKIRRERLQISEMIARVVDQLQPMAAEAGAHLQHEPCPDLPPLMADRRRIEQVLTNLVLSAIRCNSAGGEVILRAVESPEALTVVVNGEGASALGDGRVREAEATDGDGEEFEHIANRLGFGLRVAKLIVEHHGGRLWVESKAEEGLAFCFSLPLSAL